MHLVNKNHVYHQAFLEEIEAYSIFYHGNKILLILNFISEVAFLFIHSSL